MPLAMVYTELLYTLGGTPLAARHLSVWGPLGMETFDSGVNR